HQALRRHAVGMARQGPQLPSLGQHVADHRSALPARCSGDEHGLVGIVHGSCLPLVVPLGAPTLTVPPSPRRAPLNSHLMSRRTSAAHAAQVLIFLRASRIVGFSDWRRPSWATLSTGYSRRKIKVSPMWYDSSTASVIFCIIVRFASAPSPGGASIKITGMGDSPFTLLLVAFRTTGLHASSEGQV